MKDANGNPIQMDFKGNCVMLYSMAHPEHYSPVAINLSNLYEITTGLLKTMQLDVFPFVRGDIVQHVSKIGKKYVIRGVDIFSYEAWAEGENGQGSMRIINPDNWVKKS